MATKKKSNALKSALSKAAKSAATAATAAAKNAASQAAKNAATAATAAAKNAASQAAKNAATAATGAPKFEPRDMELLTKHLSALVHWPLLESLARAMRPLVLTALKTKEKEIPFPEVALAVSRALWPCGVSLPEVLESLHEIEKNILSKIPRA